MIDLDAIEKTARGWSSLAYWRDDDAWGWSEGVPPAVVLALVDVVRAAQRAAGRMCDSYEDYMAVCHEEGLHLRAALASFDKGDSE